jgi:hypothetical protein
MGLLDRLRKQGSNQSKYGGNTPPVNPLATKESKMHAFGEAPGYSLNGAFNSTVTRDYNKYDDGTLNTLPQPSNLDIKTPAQKYVDVKPA